MVVTREDFSQVVCNSYAALGFPTEAPWVYEFPNRMFVAGSDLSVINENIDKIIYGLTKWEPKRKTKGITAAQKLTVRGKDYEEALTNMHYMFLRNMWSDGLPLFPPTEERVNWILRGTDLSRDTVVAKILPGGRIASVESLSIALAMTGGRPEYLPVLIAAIEAFTEPEFRHDWMNSTTGSVYPGVVVNGPIAKQIRLNSGYSFLGPNPNFPAGGPIGRALRIVFLDIGGAIPGIGSLSISGVNRYTNMVFAEDDDGLPSGWKPLSVEQGFPEGKNVVTVVPACDYDHVMSANVSTEESLHTVLGTFGRVMDYPNLGLLRTGVDMEKMVGIVLIPRRTAVGFADLGLSKEDVRKGLWENSRISWSDIKAAYSDSYIRSAIERAGDVFVEGKPWPITRTSEQIMMVVAGGDQSGHASFVRFGGASNYIVVSKEIKLPANEKWEELLKESEMDLGPVPVA